MHQSYYTHFHEADARAYVHQKVWKHILVNTLEMVIWVTMALIDKGFIKNVLQQKVAAADKALYFIFFIHSEIKSR